MGIRKVHDFCWINLVTPEASSARAFFSGVFGWTYGEMPGIPGGSLIQVEGRAAGALMDVAIAHMPKDTPPVIGVMVKVADAAATVAKVIALGGRAEPAFDVLENGRMASCTDPNGAVFGVWQPKKEVGVEADIRAHGTPTWFETITSDAGRAVKFYAELFGWTTQERTMPGMSYTMFELDGVPIAGAMAATPEMKMGDIPPHWGTYFAVKNADESAKRVVDLGGTLCFPVHSIPDVGRFGLCKSPQGVSFHVFERTS